MTEPVRSVLDVDELCHAVGELAVQAFSPRPRGAREVLVFSFEGAPAGFDGIHDHVGHLAHLAVGCVELRGEHPMLGDGSTLSPGEVVEGGTEGNAIVDEST